MRPPFTWLVRGVLAGGPHPAHFGGLPMLIAELRRERIGAILSVTEHPLDERELRRYGIRYLWQATEDWQPPPDLAATCAFIDECKAAGTATLVHCFAGLGRTGTVLAAYLIHSGVCTTAEDAKRRVRAEYDGGAVQSVEQFAALEGFALRVRSLR
jgi:atypical dual specificity phosphatase